MTRIDAPIPLQARGPGAPATPEGALAEAAGELFERSFSAIAERGGREGGRGEPAPEGEVTPGGEAAPEAAPPARLAAALAALVFDLGRGAPPIREPGEAGLEGKVQQDPGAKPEAGPALIELLAGLIAGAAQPAPEARPMPGPRANPDARLAAPAAKAAALAAEAGATDGAAMPEAPELKPSLRGMPDLRLPGAADLMLSVKGAETAEPMKATVLAQATHFAPVLGATNIQAIADAVAGARPERAPIAFSPDLASTDPLARGAAAPVKTLTVQLEPISLGKVTLAIRLTDDGVRVDVMASDPKVVPLLNQDRELIMEAIRRAGVVPDVVTIQAGDAPSRLGVPGLQPASQGQPSGDGGQQGAPGQGGREEPGGGFDRREEPRHGAQHRRQPDEDDRSARRDRRGDLYL